MPFYGIDFWFDCSTADEAFATELYFVPNLSIYILRNANNVFPWMKKLFGFGLTFFFSLPLYLSVAFHASTKDISFECLNFSTKTIKKKDKGK